MLQLNLLKFKMFSKKKKVVPTGQLKYKIKYITLKILKYLHTCAVLYFEYSDVMIVVHIIYVCIQMKDQYRL